MYVPRQRQDNAEAVAREGGGVAIGASVGVVWMVGVYGLGGCGRWSAAFFNKTMPTDLSIPQDGAGPAVRIRNVLCAFLFGFCQAAFFSRV